MSFPTERRSRPQPQSKTEAGARFRPQSPSRPDSLPRSRSRSRAPASSPFSSSTPSPSSLFSSSSPFVPSTTELVCLASFPIAVVFGCAYASLSSSINGLQYDQDLQAFPPEHAPSYFASKSNILNLFFVKIGWVWMTAALGAFVYTYPFVHYVKRHLASSSDTTDGSDSKKHDGDQLNQHSSAFSSSSPAPSSHSDTAVRLVTQIFVRWSLITLLWVFVTQWFFGPAIIDRSFRITGGDCVATFPGVSVDTSSTSSSSPSSSSSSSDLGPQDLRILAYTRQTCRTAGGQWRHGHDISGHIFLLVIGSAMLMLEMLPYLSYRLTLPVASTSPLELAEAEKPGNEVNGRAGEWSPARSPTPPNASGFAQPPSSSSPDPYMSIGAGAKFSLGVVAASFWMILMTAMYFHTWVEKLSALVVALVGVWAVYFMPRGVDFLHEIIGTPGF